MDCQRIFLTVAVYNSMAVNNMQKMCEVLGFHSQNAAQWIQLSWELWPFCECVIFRAQHPGSHLSPGQPHCRLFGHYNNHTVNFTPCPHLCRTMKRGQCVTPAAPRQAHIYLSKSQSPFKESFSLKVLWQAFHRWLKLYIQYFVHVPTRNSTNMIIHWK